MFFRFSRDNFLPKLQHLFSKTSEISFGNTGSSTDIYNLYIPRYTTTRLQKRIKYQGVKILNKISPNIKKHIKQKFPSLLQKNSWLTRTRLLFQTSINYINIYTLPFTYVQITEKWFVKPATSHRKAYNNLNYDDWKTCKSYRFWLACCLTWKTPWGLIRRHTLPPKTIQIALLNPCPAFCVCLILYRVKSFLQCVVVKINYRNWKNWQSKSILRKQSHMQNLC